MRSGKFSSVGHRSSSRLHRWRCKTRCSPRNRAHLRFRLPRRRRHLHNQPLWPRSHQQTSRRPPPGCRRIRPSCSSPWRAISQRWGKESSSSRPARNKWPYSLPRLPIRTCAPRYQRLRHGRLPLRRASRRRRSGRRKPQHDRSANLFRSTQLRGISLVRLARTSMAEELKPETIFL